MHTADVDRCPVCGNPVDPLTTHLMVPLPRPARPGDPPMVRQHLTCRVDDDGGVLPDLGRRIAGTVR